jgi:hypothetical protein
MSAVLVDQEFMHDAPGGVVGDCFRACVATIMGLPRDEVPHFVKLGTGPDGNDVRDDDGQPLWATLTREWLAERGLTFYYFDTGTAAPAANRIEQSAYPLIILSGPSPRGPFPHAIVGDNETGEPVHDPHPSRAGIVECDSVFIIARLP